MLLICHDSNQLVENGGPYQHIGLFEQLIEQQQRPVTRCYLAGRASRGFSLLVLLFFFGNCKQTEKNNIDIGYDPRLEYSRV
jgi:membrane-associated PAP2 superfamily phosphatase